MDAIAAPLSLRSPCCGTPYAMTFVPSCTQYPPGPAAMWTELNCPAAPGAPRIVSVAATRVVGKTRLKDNVLRWRFTVFLLMLSRTKYKRAKTELSLLTACLH